MPTSGFSEGQCGHVAKSTSQYISKCQVVQMSLYSGQAVKI